MTKQNTVKKKLTTEEAKLIEGPRQRPDMMERVQSILAIAHNQDGPLKTADEVEAMLIEKMRRLGHSTMSQWATGAEERESSCRFGPTQSQAAPPDSASKNLV
jgi:hypothetical protein